MRPRVAAGRCTQPRRCTLAGAAFALAISLGAIGAQGAGGATLESPGPTRINDSRGRFVPIPDSIPHAEGAHIDRRLIRQLQWISANFDVYVTEGFAGRLPSGESVGCPGCHVLNSEHKIGLAVDLVPLDYDGSGECDASWADVTALARWAEPRRQGRPLPPFRWVGYTGDYNHGCGNHLHLSWAHDPDYRKYRPSAWVEVFRAPATKVPMAP